MLTKDDFKKLTEEEKNMLKSFFEPTKEEKEDKNITEPKPETTNTVENGGGAQKLDENGNKIEAKKPEIEPKKPEPEVPKATNEEKPNQINELVQKAVETAIEPLIKANDELKKELQEIKSKSPVANYHAKPSDNDRSKSEIDRDDFVAKYKAHYQS